ncbi:MAG: Gfo/Idh/MocA family oxidoreductase [Chloroflexota bacterium]
MRISVLGVGRLGASHAAMLAALPGVTSLTVYDADPARAKDVAAPLKAKAVATIDEAFINVDAMVIVTPTDTHAPLLKRALDAGLPAFCEKPIAMGIPETKDIVEHVRRKNGRVQIGFQRRFDAGYTKARQELASGSLGAVYSFLMVSCDRLPPPDAYIKTSGGQFKDQFIHDFDITRWLFGQEVVEVTATGSTKGVPQYEAMRDVGTSAVMLKLADGTLGLMTALRHNEAGYDIHVEIHAAKDTLAIGIDPRTPWRSVEADAPKLTGPAYPTFFVRFGDAYRAELAHFLQFAKGEAENPCTAADGLEALRIAEAASMSWRERRTVPLSEIA